MLSTEFFIMEIRTVQNTDEIWRLVDAKKGLFEQLSDQVSQRHPTGG
ncbi:MAG: hypothetical protein WA709_03200 [Stellaceae bacterium]